MIQSPPSQENYRRSADRDQRICAPAGTGSLRVAQHGARSVVTRAYATSPLRLLTPRNHGHAAWVYTSTYGGGLVDRDALHLDVHVERGATMLLATQAATKVYRSPGGTSMRIDACVDDDGVLIAWPDPVICFAGAGYAQRQRIDLRGGAGALVVDGLSSGRHGSGERWQFDKYDSRLEIRQDGKPVMIDALLLTSAHGDLAERFGRFDVVTMAALVGPVLEPHAEAIVGRVSARAVETRTRMLVSASRLSGGGCVLRMAGTSVEDVTRAMRDELSFVPALLGDDPWARKW